MSELNVVVSEVEYLPHPDADRLGIVRIGGAGGFVCVVGKEQFETGDLCVYVPPDALLTEPIMADLAKNKIGMKSNRLRAIKIRGVVSEGLCLDPKEWLPEGLVYEGCDVTTYMGIEKYEPKVRNSATSAAKGVSLWYKNENFHTYTDINRLKRNPKMLDSVQEVVATIKMHGTNFRCGIVQKEKITLWDRVKGVFGVKPVEFLVGSHNTIRRSKDKNLLKNDLYHAIAQKYDLERICKEYHRFTGSDIIFYGEVIGPGIQKGYDYGMPDHALVVFDIKVNGRYLGWDEVIFLCHQTDLDIVEEVYRGPWFLDLQDKAQAVDSYNGDKYVREGIVVKSVIGHDTNNPYLSRTIVKIMNPDYLLDKTNSDFH